MAIEIKETTISFPFSIDTYGKVSSTSDPAKIWDDKVRSSINTLIGERVMRPSLGTTIGYTILDTNANLVTTIETEVNRMFTSYFRLLTLVSINVSSENSAVNIDITYKLPNQKTSSLVVGLSALDSLGILSEMRY